MSTTLELIDSTLKYLNTKPTTTKTSNHYYPSKENIKSEPNEDPNFKTIDPNKKEESFRNFENSGRHSIVSKFYKNQHTKMTYDFVLKQREKHLKFNKCKMGIWDMLLYLDQVVDESDPDTNLTQLEHAIQTAEEAKRRFPGPEYDWFHITAFIHDLGKILAVTDESKGLHGDPQWCVVGDNFPVGCAFQKENVFYSYFKDNLDFNNSKYNTKYGIYKPNCGLSNVIMSWGHDEYLYNVCKDQSKLPNNALSIIRYHSFYPWHSKNGYRYLMDNNGIDEEALKWVKEFQKCDLYSKSHNCPKLSEVEGYYKKLIKKYFNDIIHW